MDYYANPLGAAAPLEKLAATPAQLLACMHGASYRGDAPAALGALAKELGK